MAFRVARGMDRETIDSPQFQVLRDVVEQVTGDGQPVLTSDARTGVAPVDDITILVVRRVQPGKERR